MSGIITRDGLGPFDPYWTDDIRPPLRRRRGWLVRAAFGLATAFGLVGVALVMSTRSDGPSSVGPARAPDLVETLDPSLAPLFTIDAGDGARPRYEAYIVAATGDRRDLYSLGDFGRDAPALRLELWKRAKALAPSSLFVEIAEQAAASGAAVERLEVSRYLATSQGPVEWAELSLAGARRSCVGFRLLGGGKAGLRGLACAAAGAKIDAAALECLFDRLTLTQAGREAGLESLLKGASQRRAACRAPIG
ncbi:MAG TPA: hypothetical protein VGH40_05165 [Roseiarcus sp.]|jgi:hypothetical protein